MIPFRRLISQSHFSSSSRNRCGVCSWKASRWDATLRSYSSSDIRGLDTFLDNVLETLRFLSSFMCSASDALKFELRRSRSCSKEALRDSLDVSTAASCAASSRLLADCSGFSGQDDGVLVSSERLCRVEWRAGVATKGALFDEEAVARGISSQSCFCVSTMSLHRRQVLALLPWASCTPSVFPLPGSDLLFGFLLGCGPLRPRSDRPRPWSHQDAF